jgi:arylsulfatase A
MKQNFRNPLVSLLLMTALLQAQNQQPNIIFILADDMGYGDVSFRGGKAPTPNCDRLAAEGMDFTDAHTSSSVCTPTRYGILTGRYNWRSKLKKGVLYGFDNPLIQPERQTVAGLLSANGYHSGMIGKWHLGIGWQKLPNKEVLKPVEVFTEHVEKKMLNRHMLGWDVDYSNPVVGPIANGFDSFFGIAASLDMPPYLYIRNDRAVEMGDVLKGFSRPGPASRSFDPTQCLIDFARESRQYIRTQAQDKSKPFFLYLPLTSPHTPIFPSAKWQGESFLGAYGDFLMETDWVVGEVLAELDALGIADNTLVVFTSDNGCSPRANIGALTQKGHKPNADWRGTKTEIFEGGHRVPFIVRWPAKVKAGSVNDSLVCTTDFFRTAADAAGISEKFEANTAEDSVSFLPALIGDDSAARISIVHHSYGGAFAIRKGNWKLALCSGTGRATLLKSKKKTNNKPLLQLYNLKDDPAETKNLFSAQPELLKGLVAELAAQIKKGRSTPGDNQQNDGSVPFTEEMLSLFPELNN